MKVSIVVVGLCICGCLMGRATADDKQPEVTLKGKITCGKCELEISKRCASVIVVQESGKDVVYFFDAASNKKYHGDTCASSREGEVVGTVSEADGKKTVTVTRLKYKEK